MPRTDNKIAIAANITTAWLANIDTVVDSATVSSFLMSVHSALIELDVLSPASRSSARTDCQPYLPAVSASQSLASPDFIVSMINGKSYRMLRRHLANHGLTPAEYRSRYNLGADYPMVAPTYREARSALAKKLGLGRRSEIRQAI